MKFASQVGLVVLVNLAIAAGMDLPARAFPDQYRSFAVSHVVEMPCNVF